MRAPARRGSIWRGALSSGVAAVGVVNVASAAFPAERARLARLRSALPLTATIPATAATAAAGIGLLVIARQLWHGKHRALMVSVGLLAGSVALHLAKGLDYEEAAVAAALIPLLLVRRKDFFAEGDPASLTRLFRTLPLLLVGSLAFGVAALWINRGQVTPGFGLGAALLHSGARMLLLPGPLHTSGRFGTLFDWTMPTLGLGTGMFTLYLLFRPVVQGLSRKPEDEAAARAIVREHGDDSLSFFALRRDKDYFFDASQSALLAYRYIAGYALVSGDPIGPARLWPSLLEQFDHYRRRHGWALAIVGAHPDVLPLYHAFGLRSYHMGDEAVIDPQTFSLEGRAMRNVRQSANHIERSGYSFRLFDARDLDGATRKRLLDLSAHWLGKDREYGFSMALGRIAAPEDDGWLIAAAFDPNGEPDAFLQLVPFMSGRGYSLDAMRRNRAGPAGMNDFLISRTALALRKRGCRALSLNFAALTSQMADVKGLHPVRHAERLIARSLSRSFQIESLHRFNAKFEPSWTPRYLVFEDATDLVGAALAVAQAEAFIRLPFLGRYF